MTLLTNQDFPILSHEDLRKKSPHNNAPDSKAERFERQH